MSNNIEGKVVVITGASSGERLGASIEPAKRQRSVENRANGDRAARRSMAKTCLWAAAVLGVISMAAGTLPQSPSAIPADAKKTIDKANADWIVAIKTLDDAAAAEPYADDAVFVTATGDSVRGREGVAKMMRQRFARTGPALGATITQDGLTMTGELIYEWGHAEIELGAAGHPPSKSNGRYLTVWKKDASGRWRIHRNLSLS